MLTKALPGVEPRRDHRRAQDTAVRGWLACAVLSALLVASCRTPDDTHVLRNLARRTSLLEAALDRTAEAPPQGALRVRMAFGAGADLDLYVTDLDPRSNETVYFAKHATRSGGRLLRDARCSDEAPRIDAAQFEMPHTAGLRIGVDYHSSCGAEPRAEPFVVEIAHGDRREQRRGVARPGHFDDRFWLARPEASGPAVQYMPNVK